MTLHTQFVTIAYMGLGGAALGVFFDLLRVFARQFRFRPWMISACDLLFWLLSTVFVFRLLYLANHGQVRVPIFLALAAGAGLYYLLFSKLVMNTAAAVILAVKKVFAAMLRLFDLLFVVPLGWIYGFLWQGIRFLMKLAILFYKIVLKLLYPFLWTLGKPAIRMIKRAERVPGISRVLGAARIALSWVRRHGGGKSK